MWNELLPALDVRELTQRIRENEGITYSVTQSAAPQAGYAVSVPGHEEKRPWVITEGDVLSYISSHAKALAVPGAHLGVWWDKGDKTWCFDVSIVVDDMQTAMRLGAEWKQKAVYDLANGLSLWVPDWMAWTPASQGGIVEEAIAS